MNALANGTGGYLMLTGVLSASIDDYFRLSKYFMQILAGVTNNNIILDPSGYVAPGSKIRIPFRVNDDRVVANSKLADAQDLLADLEAEERESLLETSPSSRSTGRIPAAAPASGRAAAAVAYAKRFAQGPTVAQRYIKENINRAIVADLRTCLDAEAVAMSRTGQTEDHREAARAFVEKRDPLFQGR